jgi:Flp pilus assembly protein TadG
MDTRRRSRPGGRGDRERGAVVVELALVIPMFVVLVIGITQFTVAFNVKQGVHAAAREGARVAAIGESSSQVTARTRDALAGVAVDAATVPISVVTCPNSAGQARVVVGPVTREFNIPVIDQGFDLALRGEATFRCEVQ